MSSSGARADCPVCGKNVSLCKDGTLRGHWQYGRGSSYNPYPWCPGSQQLPTTAAEPRRARVSFDPGRVLWCQTHRAYTTREHLQPDCVTKESQQPQADRAAAVLSVPAKSEEVK
jgi:hypothetical protein